MNMTLITSMRQSFHMKGMEMLPVHISIMLNIKDFLKYNLYNLLKTIFYQL